MNDLRVEPDADHQQKELAVGPAGIELPDVQLANRLADAGLDVFLLPVQPEMADHEIRGTQSNRDAIGGVITYQAGDLKRRHMKVGGGSYLSSHDPRVVLGLGQRNKLDWLEIKWPAPSTTVERFTDVPIDRYITIVEGQGKWS